MSSFFGNHKGYLRYYNFVEKLFSTTEVSALLQLGCSFICKTIHFSSAYLFIVDKKNNDVLLESQWSKAAALDTVGETAIFKINKFVYHQTKKSNGLIAAKDASRENNFALVHNELRLLHIKSLMSFEIMNTADCYGLLVFYNFNHLRELNKVAIIHLEKMINVFSRALTRTYHTQLKLSQLEHLSAAANNSLDALIQFDPQGKIVFTNQQLTTLVGKSLDELKQQNCDQFIETYVFEPDRLKVVQNYRQVWSLQERVEPFEYRFKKLGTNDLVWVQTIIFPIYRYPENSYQRQPEFLATNQDTKLTASSRRLARGRTNEEIMVRHVHPKLIGVQTILIEIPTPSKLTNPVDFLLPKLQANSDFAGALLLTLDQDFAVKSYNLKAQEFFELQANQKQVLPELLSEQTKAEFMVELNRSRQAKTECLVNVQNRWASWVLFNCLPIFDVYKSQVKGWEIIGINNSANYERLQLFSAQSERYKTLLSIAGALNGVVHPRAILRKSLLELANILNAKATLGYLKSDEQAGQFIVCSGLNDENFKQIQSDTGLKQLFNYALEYNKAVIIPELATEKRLSEFYRFNAALKSVLVLPLISEDEVIGAIGLLRSCAEVFTLADIQNCASAITQIALALRLAKNFEILKEQVINLSILNKISKSILQAENLSTALKDVFYCLNQEFKLRWLWLGIFSDQQDRLVRQISLQATEELIVVEQEQELKELKNPLTLLLQQNCILEVKSFQGLFAEEVEQSLKPYTASADVLCFPIITEQNKIVGVLSVLKADSPSDKRVELFEKVANELAGLFLPAVSRAKLAKEYELSSNLNLLVAGVAHNFNNLLQGILGEISLLRVQYTTDETISKALLQIKQATEKGAGLIKELGKLPNKPQKGVESLNLTSVINRLKGRLKKLVSRGHSLSFNLAAEKIFIKINLEQLQEILTQLINNAVFAMPNGGTIEIKTEKLMSDDAQNLGLAAGKYGVLTVKDNGVGMSQKVLEQCVNPFFTTKSLDSVTNLGTNGSGLGLAIVKSYVESNGGKLEIQSALGVGTTIKIFFPA
ncbi:MAG: GAF domain-containing protein [Deltaproteobacteria bacterium]|nr:GAF domain-containing protein [Deltaproteobacteria bacterium]